MSDEPKKKDKKLTKEYDKPISYRRSPMGNTGTKHLRAITNSGRKVYDRLFQILQTDDPDNRPKDADVIKAAEIILNRLYGPVPSAQLHVQSTYNHDSKNNSPIPNEIRVVGTSATNAELHEATLYLKEHLNRIKEAEDKRVRDAYKDYDRLEGKTLDGVLVKKDEALIWQDDTRAERVQKDGEMGTNPHERKIRIDDEALKDDE